MATKNKTHKSKSAAAAARSAASKKAARTRAIQRENERFANMNPAEQRVTIARDVLLQLDSKKLTATFGTWFEGDLKKSLVVNEDILFTAALENTRSGCNACAIGATFACAALRSPKSELTLEDATGAFDGDEMDTLTIDADQAFSFLESYFERGQLDAIESAFEQGGGGSGVIDGASDFAPGAENPTLRMRLIMENIIAHGGNFVPSVAPVPVQFHTPGYDPKTMTAIW